MVALNVRGGVLFFGLTIDTEAQQGSSDIREVLWDLNCVVFFLPPPGLGNYATQLPGSTPGTHTYHHASLP